MKRHFITLLTLLSLSLGVTAQNQKEQLNSILQSSIGKDVVVGNPQVTKVTVNDKKKTITVEVNEHGTYLPYTVADLHLLKQKMLNGVFPKAQQNYRLILRSSNGFNLDDLALGAKHKNIRPSESMPFITHLDRFGIEPSKGLSGNNIAMWQSHGWYFEKKLNRWEWQRARLFQTVEDLYTQSYVLPFLMPMLENAGANAMTPRERDCSAIEVIVDNDGHLASGTYAEEGQWSDAGTGFAYLREIYNSDPATSNPFRDGSARQAKARKGTSAKYFANLPQEGNYAVYASYKSLPGSTPEAIYTINHKGGKSRVKVNQNMGGGTWIYLGHYDLPAGKQDIPTVVLEGEDGKILSADAVKIGGGMGNIARGTAFTDEDGNIALEEVISNYPRFTEGARYFLQWAGMPDSIYSTSGGDNDYRDDYTCRAHWVNYIAGGSSMLPDREGLNIPVDLSFAFHSDAGTTPNDSIIGTLGIYSTDEMKPLPSGTNRLSSRDLTDMVQTQIVNDIRAKHEPRWTRRGMWDKKYYEARATLVPAMLLELLSHQNFADMKYGMDPEFRFTVSRAIYKGILRYIAARDGREVVVQPLAVKNMEILPVAGTRDYTISWAPTPDPLEPSALPTYYIIEERVNDGGFSRVAVTADSNFTFTAADSEIHSFRVIAGNDGGISFPSEVLALCHIGSAPAVEIVNGFTRVSGPDTFDSGEIAGFYSSRDNGVPYIQDINFIGNQFEFRRDIPWSDDDAAGFGASRANFETKVVAGNTFDYVYRHGLGFKKSGLGFVSSSAAAFENREAGASAPNVDIIFGKQKEITTGTGKYGSRCKTFTAALQKQLTRHALNKGNILVSGAYIATDIWDNPFSDKETREADIAFAKNILGYNWRVGQATVEGGVYEVPTPFKAFGRNRYEFNQQLSQDSYAVESPDSFFASDSRGATLMRYSENNLVAGTVMSDTEKGYKVVALGFPVESMKSQDAINSFIAQVADFFTKK